MYLNQPCHIDTVSDYKRDSCGFHSHFGKSTIFFFSLWQQDLPHKAEEQQKLYLILNFLLTRQY